MTNRNKDEAARVVEAFLVDNPSPQTSDWKRLIDAYPQHATEIVDAALANAGGEKTVDDSEKPFNDALFNSTISRVLNLVHTTPSPLLKVAEERVAAIQGPAVKNIAVAIGIGPHTSLLSGVLVGRTLAPRRVISQLGRRLDVPIAALAEVFRRSFVESEVPAFKAPNDQPKVMTQPISWEEAVKAMKLSPKETERLLKLRDEE